jgi:hypothetical protein
MCFRPPQVGLPKKCPSCGAMNQSNLTHCKKCKTELPEGEVPMIKCPACGAENRFDTDACDNCGLLVEEMVERGLVIPEMKEPSKTGAMMPPGLSRPPAVPPGAPPRVPGSPPRAPGSPPKAPGAPKVPGV